MGIHNFCTQPVRGGRKKGSETLLQPIHYRAKISAAPDKSVKSFAFHPNKLIKTENLNTNFSASESKFLEHHMEILMLGVIDLRLAYKQK